VLLQIPMLELRFIFSVFTVKMALQLHLSAKAVTINQFGGQFTNRV
jgi:hypothetical protein